MKQLIALRRRFLQSSTYLVAWVVGLDMLALSLAHAMAVYKLGDPNLGPWSVFGYRQTAMIDFWIFQHTLAGVYIGSAVIAIGRRWEERLVKDWSLFIMAILILAYIWELLELMIEAGMFGPGWQSWKLGFEHWSNRMFADPAAVVFGAMVARRWPKLWPFASVLSLIWLGDNFSNNNSMTRQTMILNWLKSFIQG